MPPISPEEGPSRARPLRCVMNGSFTIKHVDIPCFHLKGYIAHAGDRVFYSEKPFVWHVRDGLVEGGKFRIKRRGHCRAVHVFSVKRRQFVKVKNNCAGLGWTPPGSLDRRHNFVQKLTLT